VNWRRLILVTFCAALSFGGSFTCHGSTHSSSFTENPTTGAK